MDNSNHQGRFEHEKFTRLFIFYLSILRWIRLLSVCIFESIGQHPSEVIKIKGLHKMEVTEKCSTQLTATSNSHDSQFISLSALKEKS